ncbi:MAG: aminoacyl-tRNA deacylase [Candidatus Atribacteria bacterium]|nr:MAG: aminoacyl-tRNA deacylase [Candidatus Atribacteria bacterium]
MATRGIQLLKERGIAFEVLTYRYDKMGARVAAEAIGQPEGIVLKSLVFQADDRSFLFALVSGDVHVSLRSLGRASGHKHVEAASPRDAERITGYQVGGISPLGSRSALPVLIDEAATRHESLIINAGGRGTLVRLATSDLIGITHAVVADIRGI